MKTDEPIHLRDVARIVNPEASEGRVFGHHARRLIGGDTSFSDPFVVMAEDWMPPGAFPRHPHRGMETVTFVIEGAVEHSDSAGNSGVIYAGDAQWMTAGRGIYHEENAPSGTIAHTLQLWVNMPAAKKMTSPRYQDLVGSSMPVRQEAGVEVRVFSGQSGDVISLTLNHVPITMLDVRIESGAMFQQSLPADDNAFIYVLAGALRIGNARARVTAGQLAWLTRSEGRERSELLISADDEDARLLVFSGRPLREPVALGGPFVMNTPEEIQQAFDDFQTGKF
ncbi:pirin family protein [Pseudomonas sp. AIG]